MAAAKTKRFMVPRHWTLAQRLAHYSAPPNENGCVLWLGTVHRRKGYGQLQWCGHKCSAHRLAWESSNGPIPDGMHVCHRCDVPGCINPAHLFLGTNADNTADKVTKRRQSRGHAHGMTVISGEKHPCAKLTADQVRAIRFAAGTQREIAARFGVHQSRVWMIKSGKGWRHT